jgi:hypothetical protein
MSCMSIICEIDQLSQSLAHNFIRRYVCFMITSTFRKIVLMARWMHGQKHLKRGPPPHTEFCRKSLAAHTSGN